MSNELKKLASLELKSSVSTLLNADYHDRKSRQREKLRVTYCELNNNTKREEESVKEEIAELQLSLEVLTTKEKRKELNFKLHAAPIVKRIENTQRKLEKTRKAAKRLNDIVQELDWAGATEKNGNMKTFETSLKPLQDAQEIIQEEKSTLENALNALSTTLQALELRSAALLAQHESDECAIKSLESQKAVISRSFQELKSASPLEYSETVKEVEIQSQLASSTERKAQQAVQLHETEIKLGRVELELCTAKGKLVRWEVQRKSGNYSNIQEMDLEDLETQLHFKCEQLNAPPVPRVVEQSMKELGIDIAQCISREQFRLMEAEENRLRERAALQEQTYTHKRLELNRKIKEQENEYTQFARTNSLNTGLKHSARQLQLEADAAARQTHCVLARLSQWKLKNKHWTVPSPSQWPQDCEILQNFSVHLQSSSVENYLEIEGLLGKYTELLQQRDGITNTSITIEIKGHNELEHQRNYIKILESQRISLELERESLHKEFTKLVEAATRIREKQAQNKAKAEVQRKLLIQRKCAENLHSRKKELKKFLRDTSGPELKQLEVLEHGKVRRAHNEHIARVKKEIQGLYASRAHWDQQIAGIRATSSQDQLRGLAAEITQTSASIHSYEDSLRVLNEAAEELAAKQQAFRDVKLRELKHKHSKQIAKCGGNTESEPQNELYAQCETLSSDLEQLKSELSDLQRDRECGALRLSSAKNMTFNRLKKLEDALVTVNNDKTKVARLQKKLRLLDQVVGHSGLLMTRKMATPENTHSDRNNSVSRNSLVSVTEEESPTHIAESPVLDPVAAPVTALLSKTLSAHEIPHCYHIDLKGTTHKEQLFFEAVLPLLEGAVLYKKFSSNHSFRTPEFDPLLAGQVTVEKCGYSPCKLALHKSLSKIEVKHLKTLRLEQTVQVSTVKSPVIPKHTMEIIKSQKKQWLLNTWSEDTLNEELYRTMKEARIMTYEDPVFQSQSRTAQYYPFSITLQTGKIDLVADDYIVFRQWVSGLHALLAHKSQLNRLKHQVAFN